MKPKPFFAAGLALHAVSFAFAPSGARAQKVAPAAPSVASNASAQATVPQQATPQNSNATGSANPTGAAGTTSIVQPAQKKVWTNDDMGDVHARPEISTFSGSNGKGANGKSTAGTQGSKNGNGKQYRQQISNLQAKLPPLDEQISQLQAGLNGATMNSTRHLWRSKNR